MWVTKTPESFFETARFNRSRTSPFYKSYHFRPSYIPVLCAYDSQNVASMRTTNRSYPSFFTFGMFFRAVCNWLYKMALSHTLLGAVFLDAVLQT